MTLSLRTTKRTYFNLFRLVLETALDRSKPDLPLHCFFFLFLFVPLVGFHIIIITTLVR